MILTLSIAVLILYVDNKRTKECLSGYIREDNAATAQRAQAALETDAAVDAMVTNVLQGQTGEERRQALENYVISRKAAEDKRRANPVPPFPKGC
jgi:hypothetical protein